MSTEVSVIIDDLCAGIACSIFAQKLKLLRGESDEQEADPVLCDPAAVIQCLDTLFADNCVTCKVPKIMEWLSEEGGNIFIPVTNNDGSVD